MKWILRTLLSLFLLGVIILLVLRTPDKSLDELKPLYTDEESEWLIVDGMEVHHKREGNGDAIVLLHGTGASLHTWDGWAERLDDHFEVYRMDLPAFGLTGPDPDADYTIESYVSFVDHYVEQLGVDSFAIAGNSLGGYIAWAYTVAHPDKVEKLILLDAAGYPSDEDSDALAFKIATNPILRPLMKMITPKSLIAKNLQQVYTDQSKITNELIDRYYDMALREGNRQAFIDRVHTDHTDISNRISEISCPTLIMWGAEDTWVNPEDAHRFDADILDSELIMYEGVGHVPMEEIPVKTAEDAVGFLKATVQ